MRVHPRWKVWMDAWPYEMNVPCLLVFGGRRDPHVTRVADRLLQGGANVYFFDLDADIGVHACVSDQISLELFLTVVDYKTGEVVELPDGPTVAWIRYKWPKHPIVSGLDQERFHRLSEFEFFFYEFLRSRAIKHFNARSALELMDSKLAQLSLASRLGFAIPNTIVSSRPDKIVNFVSDNDGDCIMKAFQKSFIPPAADGSRKAFTIMTNAVTGEDIVQDGAESLSWAPCIFQDRIEKAYELRIVATQRRCVAYKIDSQNSELGQLDWRHAQFEKIFASYELSRAHEALFIEFVKQANLHYGVFDAAVTRDGELVFIECNADGQWAWLERDCQSDDITQALVEMIDDLLNDETSLEASA